MTVPTWISHISLRRLEQLPDGVRWLEEDEAKDELDELRRRYEHMPMGTLWPGDTYEHAVEMSKRVFPVMQGPTSSGAPEPHSVVWYYDEEHDALQAAMSSEVAPLLWLQCEPTPSAIAKLASQLEYREGERTGRFRALMGDPRELMVPNVYSGELVEADAAQLTNYWLFNPYRPSDPLASALTSFSHSIVRCERHTALGLYVWDMEYVPASFAAKVESLNQKFNAELPLDLPLDAIGCVLGFRVESETFLQQQLTEAPHVNGALTEYWLSRVAALRYAQPTLADELRPYMTDPHPVVRYGVAMAAGNAGLNDLFIEIRDSETDPVNADYFKTLKLPDGPMVTRHMIG